MNRRSEQGRRWHRSYRGRRARAVCAAATMAAASALAGWGCTAAPPALPPTNAAAACAAGEVNACEKAITGAADAELLPLLEQYDRALGLGSGRGSGPSGTAASGGWSALAAWLDGAKAPVAAITLGHGGSDSLPPDLPRYELDGAAAPRSLHPSRLLLAVGRRAGAGHLLWLAPTEQAPAGAAEVTHLFPTDLLGPHLLGLEGIARGATGRARIAAELALCGTVHDALTAARRFDYVTAAEKTDEIRTRLAAIDAATEVTARARYVLNVMDAAAIGLEPPPGAEDTAEPDVAPASAATAVPTAEPSGPQAAYVRVLLAGTEYAQEWGKRRASLASVLSEERMRVLDQVYRPASDCPRRVVPPMDGAGDLLFGARLGTVLDMSVPGGTPKRDDGPSLPIADWLVRYETMVRLVEQTGTAWSFLPALLNERGELWGLSASGTATYLRVTDLSIRHLKALRALADHAPARFRPLGLLSLFQLRGVAGDARVSEELGSLTGHAVSEALLRAEDEDSLYDAATTAAMMAMSLPPALQGVHLTLIREALSTRLARGVRAEPWGKAGMYGLEALVALITGDAAGLRASARHGADALSVAGAGTYESLAPLVAAAARYVALAGTDALDPATANPSLFGPARTETAASLRKALEGLAPGGPTTPQERDLLRSTAEVADATIAIVTQAVVGATRAAGQGDPAASESTCSGSAELRDRADLREPLARLDRSVRKLVARPAFRQGDSAWLRKARLVGLVLSDTSDVLSRGPEGANYRLPEREAAELVDQGLRGWTDSGWTDIVAGGYLLARNALGAEQERGELSRHVARLLRGLGATFAPADAAAGTSIFEALASISASADVSPDADAMARLFLGSAERCYDRGAAAQGDLLLFVALGVAIAREVPVADEVVTLAQKHQRPVALPLLDQSFRMQPRKDPAPLLEAMRKMPQGHCFAPDPEPVIALRRAAYDFRSGQRERAVEGLESFLRSSEQRGLVVPRVVYTYEEHAGHKVLRLEGSLSWGSAWLSNSGTLHAGIGVQTSAKAGGELAVRFADKGGLQAQQEAARVYAHAAAVLAIYRYEMGDGAGALAAAQRAIGAWVLGVRLGDDGVAADASTAEWARDALPAIAVAAQLAAEAGHVFVAGDLWSLARAALGPDATDETVDGALESLPITLDGIEALEPVVTRAGSSLRVVTAGLPCTKRAQGAPSLLQADCASYPMALAYRVSDGLTALPRLRRGAEVGRPGCAALRSLDEFLAAADERRYDPDAFTTAVTALASSGREVDAAFLLARQRHPEHCTPGLVELARKLAAREALGPHLRSDLLSIAANCSAGRVDAQLVADLRNLDDLTQRLPVAVRNLQVVLFGARVGLATGRWDPLLALTDRPDFVPRWLRFGPEAGTAALLIHHAALAAAGRPIDGDATAPAYQLLCTTYPPADRAPLCQTIGLLRADSEGQDRQRAARDGLTALLTRLTGEAQTPQAAPAP